MVLIVVAVKMYSQQDLHAGNYQPGLELAPTTVHPAGLESFSTSGLDPGLEALPSEQTPYYQKLDGYEYNSVGDAKMQRNTIWGINRTLFWVLVALLCALIVGAGVGGGIAASLHNKNNKQAVQASSPRYVQ